MSERETPLGDDRNGLEPPAPQPARSGRWLRIALILSLAFNLLFVGFAASRFMHHGPRHHLGGPRLGFIAAEGRHFIRELPRERRRELREIMRSHREEFRSERMAMEDEMRKFAQALRSEPYDRAAVEQALGSLRQNAGGLLSRGEQVTLEVVSALTRDERAGFSERLLDRLER